MLSKKLILIVWITVIVISWFILCSSIIVGYQALIIYKYGTPNWKIYNYPYPYAINWFRLCLIPISITVAVFLTAYHHKESS